MDQRVPMTPRGYEALKEELKRLKSVDRPANIKDIEEAIEVAGLTACAVLSGNRNFEGRQGPGGRTVLASPETAAASAIAGVIADPRPAL